MTLGISAVSLSNHWFDVDDLMTAIWEGTQHHGVSVVLPVLNERENLEYLVDEISNEFLKLGTEFEIIVSDDGSTDGTKFFIETLAASNRRIVHIDRSTKKASLPDSIFDGIERASYDLVLWMDADGSMPANLIPILINKYRANSDQQETIVVGSRFVEGGGFKGSDGVSKTSLLRTRSNLSKSNDSFMAVILSRLLNRYLWLMLGRCCKDPASGFVLCRKSYVFRQKISGSYGDYCPRFIYQAFKSGVRIVEVPYVCVPRRYGTSKTGVTMRQLVSRGVPYVVLPFSIRRSVD
jgi:glycosyltransferase involved in cell wall biosynthesis